MLRGGLTQEFRDSVRDYCKRSCYNVYATFWLLTGLAGEAQQRPYQYLFGMTGAMVILAVV
jgi:hypothetical protein